MVGYMRDDHLDRTQVGEGLPSALTYTGLANSHDGHVFINSNQNWLVRSEFPKCSSPLHCLHIMEEQD